MVSVRDVRRQCKDTGVFGGEPSGVFPAFPQANTTSRSVRLYRALESLRPNAGRSLQVVARGMARELAIARRCLLRNPRTKPQRGVMISCSC